MPFQSSYSCSDCGYRFTIVTEHRPRGRCPGCPKCKEGKHSSLKSISKSNIQHTPEESDKRVKEICESRQAPVMGVSTRTKAIDATAEIVMQDYGMTDVNIGSNLREGDNCVPKLRPDLEQKVDKVFAPQPNKVMGMQGASQLNQALMKQINSGIYRNQGDPIMRATETVQRKPTTVMYEYRPEKTN